MATLMLWSKSTMVSLGQSFRLISSRVTIFPFPAQSAFSEPGMVVPEEGPSRLRLPSRACTIRRN